MIKQGADVVRGNVKNPYYPGILGRGFIGVGEFASTYPGAGTRKEYLLWKTMLVRCYDPKKADYYRTYLDKDVCEHWYNYQNFAYWCQDQAGFNLPYFELDKDILVPGNKIYSPETCVFVPREVNCLFTGYRPKKNNLPRGVVMAKLRYRVHCPNVEGGQVYVGQYKTLEEAVEVYRTNIKEVMNFYADKYKDIVDPRVCKALLEYEPDKYGLCFGV
jgi:hypothetical protein